ncbi:MAG: sortase [Candidatus Falkowbacteria bacterium]|nr:sortase [Candidatus Falkowbacteria bacterium]
MKIIFFQPKRKLKALVYALEFLALLLALYLILLPFYPLLRYEGMKKEEAKLNTEAKKERAVKEVAQIKSYLPNAKYAVSPNRLIITKIGVNAPIVEAKNEQVGLNLGAWRVPESSTPDQGGNTVITGHRFKYLPPNNLTFYLLDKLIVGDIFSVIWQGKDYYYRVKETKVVPSNDLSVLNSTDQPIITLFTCTPIYSTKNRLVVVGELIE